MRHANALAEQLIGAWNSQDVERVVACYTDDVTYIDPNTRGPVQGAEAMGKYLGKLFGDWKMTWKLTQAYPFADGSGCAAMWHATLRPAGGGPTVDVDGMDLVMLEGDRVKRNEVYFDRAVLAGLM